MFRSILTHTSIFLFLSAALLGGCAGGSPGSSASFLALSNDLRGRAASPPAARNSRDWMYLAQLYGNDASVYQRDRLSLTYYETISTGLESPYGTVATPSGWWYVANGGHSNIIIYRTTANGPSGAVGSLDDFGEIPVNVAVIPSRRLVAVANFGTTGGGAGSVSVYLNRQVEPARTLTYGTALNGMGVAIDHQGNCYWSVNDPRSKKGSIVEFTGCNGAGAVVVSGIAQAGGIAFDQSDDLYYVEETGAARGVWKCKKTSQCALFATGPAPSGFGMPININFDHKDKHIWVADATGYVDAVNVRGKTVYSFAVGGSSNPPFGIAPAPGG